MKSLVTLQLAVLRDAGLHIATPVDRDSQEILSRVEHEGESFLTITLPTFAKALEKGLRDGQWPRNDMPSFRHRRGLPLFLRGFLARVFSDDGAILDVPDAQAIWAVRQVTNLLSKVDRLTTPKRERKAMVGFVETDVNLGEHFAAGLPDALWESFEMHSLALFGDLFNSLDRKVAAYELIPSHGPGAVADRLDHAERWEFAYWTDRLETVFPRWRYTRNLPAWSICENVPQEQERPVRVIAVPKTQAKPRIIAIEPSSVQYAQQGLKREIYQLVDRSPLRDVLGFTDQTRNHRMALKGSIDGSIATLDLSEASDRVHLSVVERLLKRWPHLLDYVLATRSERADIDGQVVHLSKFASMGSALTFPLEAIVFTTLCSMGVFGQWSPASPRRLRGIVSVYGDDIIIPVDSVGDVVHFLEAFGFKVNENKSFWTGRFRESCGREYYDGTDVSVVRLRADVPTSRRDAVLMRRFTDFRNRCFRAGLWQTVKVADEFLLGVMPIPPRWLKHQIDDPASVLALDSTLRPRFRARYDRDLQTWFERYPSVRATPRPYTVDGEAGVLKWFHENHDNDESHQRDRYENQERAHTFRIKWARLEASHDVSSVSM